MYFVDLRSADYDEPLETVEFGENLEPIWMSAGLDMFDINGLEAHEAEPVVERALQLMNADPNYYILWAGAVSVQMDYEAFGNMVDSVEKLRDACIDYPGAQIDVRY